MMEPIDDQKRQKHSWLTTLSGDATINQGCYKAWFPLHFETKWKDVFLFFSWVSWIITRNCSSKLTWAAEAGLWELAHLSHLLFKVSNAIAPGNRSQNLHTRAGQVLWVRLLPDSFSCSFYLWDDGGAKAGFELWCGHEFTTAALALHMCLKVLLF